MDCIATHDSTAQQQQELVRKANDEYAEKLKALQGVCYMLEGRSFSCILTIDRILADHDKILREEQEKLKEMSEKHTQELKELQGKPSGRASSLGF